MSFLAPWCLLGAIAVAVPFWLHRRRTADERALQVASVYLLTATAKEVPRDRKLDRLALLALRCAIVFGLATAFAQPLWTRSGSILERTPGAQDVVHVIVIDASLSMRHGDRFERARSAALTYLEELPESAPVEVLSVGDRVVSVAAHRSARSDQLRAVRALEPGFGRATDARMRAAIEDLKTHLREEPELPTQLRVFWISDFQRSGLDRAPAESADAVQLVPYSVAAEPMAANQWIEAVTLEPQAGGGASVSVRVRARGPASSARSLLVEVEGTEVARRELELPDEGRVDVSLALPFERPVSAPRSRGEGSPLDRVHGRRVVVRLAAPGALPDRVRDAVPEGVSEATADAVADVRPETTAGATAFGDRLSADDVRYLALQLPRPLRIGVVTSSRDAVASRYVQAALDAANPGHWEWLQILPAELDQNAFSGRDVFVLLDVALGDESRVALRDFVARGGTAIWFVGERSIAADRDARASLGLLGLGEPELETAPQSFVIAPPATSSLTNRRDFVLAEFAEPLLELANDSRWSRLQVFRRLRFELRDDRGNASASAAVPLIETEGGVPLLFVRPLGRGRHIVFGSNADAIWNDLPLQPTFLSLLAGSLASVRAADEFRAPAVVGSSWLSDGEGQQVFDPAGEPLLSLLETQSEQRVQLNTPGFYRTAGGGPPRWIAVNPDPRESDLQSVPLPKDSDSARDSPQTSRSAGAQEPVAPIASPPTPLGYAALIAVVALLWLESIWANLSQWRRARTPLPSSTSSSEGAA